MLHFLEENYKWLFSGVGVTAVVYIVKMLSKIATRGNSHDETQIKQIKKEETDTFWAIDNKNEKGHVNISEEIIERLRANRETLSSKNITITNSNNMEEEVEVILAFEFKDTDQEYVVYTKNERDKYQNVTIYVSKVVRKQGSVQLKGISDKKEWNRVREVLIVLAESDVEQPVFDEEGIELI